MCITERRLFRQRGLTLIELVVFIVIVSIAVAGVLLALNQAVRSSADPQVHKQALAIAEALLEEIELHPFTFCDPDDANASTATSAAVGVGEAFCATTVEAIGREAGEARPFDNVNDYHGLAMAAGAVADVSGNVLGGLGGYSAAVAVANDGNLGAIANAEVLRITVTVTGPDGNTVTLDGYRSRYGPRT